MDRMRMYAEASQAAVVFFVAVMLGLWFGRMLDDALGTGGILTLTLIFAGLGGAVINLIKTMGRIFNGGKR
jgi:F0F1-type ATP synthase assembly protein I